MVQATETERCAGNNGGTGTRGIGGFPGKNGKRGPTGASGVRGPVGPKGDKVRFHMQTLNIYELGFNRNYCTFTLISLIKIVRCSQFP